MAKRKARIGIIGCGRIAREGHLPYLKENPDVELVAAMDINDTFRDKICDSFGIAEGCRTPEELFDRGRLDGVLICTPNWVHKDLTLMAAERGAHVFCEKPMAVSVAECEEMVAACEKAGVFLMMGMAKRFDAGIAKAKTIIQSGGLGAVSQITTSCLNPPPPRLDSALFQNAKKWASAIGIDIEQQMGLWRLTDPRTGGGQMLEMGTHLLDIMFFLAGEKPADSSGFIKKNRPDMQWEDQGSLLIKFPSGMIASAEMNMSATADNIIGEKGRIYGDKASLSFNLINGMWFGLPFYHYIPTLLFRYGALSPLTGIATPVPVPANRKIYMYKRQMDYFADKILGRDTDYFGFGPDFAAFGGDGLAAMRVIEKAYIASGVGK
ncbi:MAG: Gfo/Idh/MocA family oxidoreductase [bacterium]